LAVSRFRMLLHLTPVHLTTVPPASFCSGSGAPRDLPSFPTRRSSDLWEGARSRSESTTASASRSWGGTRALTTRPPGQRLPLRIDRKSTRLNSSHVKISYAVFCLKKKKKKNNKKTCRREQNERRRQEH